MNTINASIVSIHIYPIKGMGGIDIDSAKVLERGLANDRRWMLVDEKGDFITQRTDSRLALFKCKLGTMLEVFFEGDTISIDLEQYSSHKIETSVWGSRVMTYEVSTEISEWFTNKLGINCHLVKMVNEFDRYKKLIKGPKQTKVSFADGYPYLLIGTASIVKVSKEVGYEIPANRFRANIIVETDIPHIEDSWDIIKLGSSQLQIIKPCARCAVVNIDQISGANESREPLKSLSQYRREGNKVNFGANVVCLREGSIRIGDIVENLF